MPREGMNTRITAEKIPGKVRGRVMRKKVCRGLMILTCLTAAMAGYALAKKRFVGRKLLFTLIVLSLIHIWWA